MPLPTICNIGRRTGNGCSSTCRGECALRDGLLSQALGIACDYCPTAACFRCGGALTHVFPTPVALAKADLATLGMPRSRAAALSAVAAAVLVDPHLFDVNSELDDAIRLRAIRGVGEWTAQYIGLRQLREPDAFPAADVGLIPAITKREGREPSSSELLDRANCWRPWRAYAAQHLWAAA
jgi:AraC family transcriptional regulator of adaptative response / DNA-3-methyladenine glycosylase II